MKVIIVGGVAGGASCAARLNEPITPPEFFCKTGSKHVIYQEGCFPDRISQ